MSSKSWLHCHSWHSALCRITIFRVSWYLHGIFGFPIYLALHAYMAFIKKKLEQMLRRLFNRVFYVDILRELQLVSQVVLKIKKKSYFASSISIMGPWWVRHSWQKRKCLCHKLFFELELRGKTWLMKIDWKRPFGPNSSCWVQEVHFFNTSSNCVCPWWRWRCHFCCLWGPGRDEWPEILVWDLCPWQCHAHAFHVFLLMLFQARVTLPQIFHKSESFQDVPKNPDVLSWQ